MESWAPKLSCMRHNVSESDLSYNVYPLISATIGHNLFP